MLSQIDPAVVVTMSFVLIAYVVAVRVLEFLSERLRSITFIKSVHTIVFIPLSGLLFVLAYEAVTGRITYFTRIAIAVFAAETLELVTHNWKCPLTQYAERLGSKHAQITDFFFPKWFADRVFLVYGGLFTVSLVSLAIRLII